MSHERGLEALPVWNNFAVLEKAAFQRHQLWRPLEEKTSPVGAVLVQHRAFFDLVEIISCRLGRAQISA